MFEIDCMIGEILLAFENFLESEGLERNSFYSSDHQPKAEASYNDLRKNALDLYEENRLLKEKIAIMSQFLPSGVDYYTTRQDEIAEEIVRHAGCNCESPLLGYRIGKGPRCRLCNVESRIIYKE